MHLCVVSSGSLGNLAYIGDRETGRDSAGFLIDSGVTRVLSRLRSSGVDIRTLRSCVYTHHHSDHFRPATFSILAKSGLSQYIPPYMQSSLGIAGEGLYSEPLEIIADDLRAFFGDSFNLAEFPCVHDVPCVGYSVTLPDDSLMTWASDTVSITPELRALLTDTSVLCIDCNYDADLMYGTLSSRAFPKSVFRSAYRLSSLEPYPEVVRDRIVSRGHLDTARVLDLVASAPWVEHVILLHMSSRYQDIELLTERIRRHSGLNPACKFSYAIQNRPVDIPLGFSP